MGIPGTEPVVARAIHAGDSTTGSEVCMGTGEGAAEGEGAVTVAGPPATVGLGGGGGAGDAGTDTATGTGAAVWGGDAPAVVIMT